MAGEQKSFRVSITLQGGLARAFIEEFAKSIRENPSTSKSDVARDLMVEGLRARGHDVENTVEWGGYRQRQSDEEGQPLAVSAA